MLAKLFSSLLLTGAAMAVDDNCIELYEDMLYKGTTATLCYASKDEYSSFNLEDYGIESIGSYKAGAMTAFYFCDVYSPSVMECFTGVGP